MIIKAFINSTLPETNVSYTNNNKTKKSVHAEAANLDI